MFTFTNDCLIGVAEIDAEHKRLFELITNTDNALKNDEDPITNSILLIGELKQYAITHFAHEEEYMQRINDPELERQKEEHAEFIEKVRSFGYKIKLDTNGYRPEVIDALLAKNLLDYIAMDIKSGHSNYIKVSGFPNLNMENIKKSISLIENAGIPYEFRTTVVKELHSEKDFLEITNMLSKESPYFIQSFKDSGNVLTPGLSSCNIDELNNFLSIVKTKLSNASLRGIE